MCSPGIFDVVGNLEAVLNHGFPDSSGFFSDIKVYKCQGDRKDADYICNTSSRQTSLEASKIYESKCVERMPWLRDYIRVTVGAHGFMVSLNRNLCFSTGLNDVHRNARGTFGNNSLFVGKTFDVSVIETKDPTTLTGLRIELLNDIVCNIIEACGGTLNSTGCNTVIRISNQNIKPSPDTVDITVGHVSCPADELKTSFVNSNSYKRIRMDEISQICENKLDFMNQLCVPYEDRCKLLHAAILFDLIQPVIWRNVILRILHTREYEYSSCKGLGRGMRSMWDTFSGWTKGALRREGEYIILQCRAILETSNVIFPVFMPASMFVLYNYARLASLIAQFNQKVSSGVYPPLPSLENIDFNLLSQEDEWKLMFLSILSWPSVLKNSVMDLVSGRPKIHLIFEFLRMTASNFSHYYSKTKIFMEPSHFLPLMFARIHLLNGLLEVFNVAFKIVSICPLNKM